MKWGKAGHISRIREKRNWRRDLEGKSEGKRILKA
jgi:hypothetical protein